ncbi:hypothetical protein ACSBR1_033307 [Camellia fascicularis]
MKGVGQRFAQGVVEFRDALLKYSIHSGFNFDFVKNDKDHVTVHCKRRADLGCLWSVHARVENYSKAFVIKQFDDVHICGSSFRTIKHSKMTSNMIGGQISSDIRNKALTSVSEVICDFKDYYGTEVSYRRAWMGVEKASGLVFGDYSSSFDDLHWYVDAANACNPGSVFYMEFDIDSKGRHFKCLFFAFEACIHGFKYCRPVLMLDGTFLKGRHKDQLDVQERREYLLRAKSRELDAVGVERLEFIIGRRLLPSNLKCGSIHLVHPSAVSVFSSFLPVCWLFLLLLFPFFFVFLFFCLFLVFLFLLLASKQNNSNNERRIRRIIIVKSSNNDQQNKPLN